MLCETCPKRATCKAPCEALEKYLSRFTSSGWRETPKLNDVLDWINNQDLPHTWQEIGAYHQYEAHFPFLSDLDNKILNLRITQGLTYKKIAICLSGGRLRRSLGQDAVKKRYYRAIKRLCPLSTHL